MIDVLQNWWSSISPREMAWLCAGLAGQALFSGRWIIQWLASEQNRRSTMPEAFWYLSFAGGLMVLSYGIHKMDPVIILGQFGILIYARNLFFIRQYKVAEERPEPRAIQG